jgi:hypothetical protein
MVGTITPIEKDRCGETRHMVCSEVAEKLMTVVCITLGVVEKVRAPAVGSCGQKIHTYIY